MAEAAIARRKRVVILGGGFGGINAAMDLAKLPVDVTIVDRKNYHLFQPLLYQVALAVLSPADIAQPIRSLVRDHPNIDVLMDEAIRVDLPRRRVYLNELLLARKLHAALGARLGLRGGERGLPPGARPPVPHGV